MELTPYMYLAFTVALGLIFAGIIALVYWPTRKEHVEEAKYRMLDDDDEHDH